MKPRYIWTPTAFNERKRRNAFPVAKFLALTALRPELKLDVAYVLTGTRAIHGGTPCEPTQQWQLDSTIGDAMLGLSLKADHV